MSISDTIIVPTAAAVATQIHVTIGDKHPAVTIAADNLAGAETVTIYVRVLETWKQVTDLIGTPIVLTSSLPAVVLEGGPLYGVTKSATAGLCGVVAIPTTRGF